MLFQKRQNIRKKARPAHLGRVQIQPEGKGYYRTPGIYSDDDRDMALRAVEEGIGDLIFGCAVAVFLGYCGSLVDFDVFKAASLNEIGARLRDQ